MADGSDFGVQRSGCKVLGLYRMQDLALRLDGRTGSYDRLKVCRDLIRFDTMLSLGCWVLRIHGTW